MLLTIAKQHSTTVMPITSPMRSSNCLKLPQDDLNNLERFYENDGILVSTSVLYLIFRASVILIVGLRLYTFPQASIHFLEENSGAQLDRTSNS